MLYRGLKYLLVSFVSMVLLYGAWLMVRCLVFDYFTIPSFSMTPTLKVGDKVVVNKLLVGPRIYKNLNFSPTGKELESWRLRGLRSPRHNDIVVFNFPHHDSKISFVINNVFCKRVVGMPGDSLRIVGGHYCNNNYEGVLGVEDEQTRLEHMPDSLLWPPSRWTIPYDWHFPWTIRDFGPLYIPRKGDVMNVTPYEATLYRMLLAWEMGLPIECDWESKTVWAGDKHLTQHQWQHDYYFMAGDNVLDSNDSRYWGLVPEEYVVGIVDYIINKENEI